LDGKEQRAVYVGVDPSADSLHVGNLLPLIAALHFVQHGHRVVVVIGGATGSIGDPSGRSTERSALSMSELNYNVKKITDQVHDFFVKAEESLVGTTQSLMEAEPNSNAEEIPMQKAAEASNGKESEVASEKAMDIMVGADLKGDKTSSFNVTVVNNQEWYENMNVLAFLRNVGKLARVGTMLARDSVKSRMQPIGEGGTTSQAPVGLSFTEFSYQLLQAYDFSVLHGAPWHCTIQLGGSDQMGNIMAGIDLIRKQKVLQEAVKDDEEGGDEEAPAYGLTLPLLTTSSGAKFGKSAGNAVWLSPEKCSDYEFYQFFHRSRDDEVELYLKTLTMLSIEAIKEVVEAHREDPSQRRAQKVLAARVTELVRGKKAVKRAEAATRVLFETHLDGLQAEDVLDAFKRDRRLHLLDQKSCLGIDLRTLAVDVGLTKTKSEAKRFIASGGFYINNVAVEDANRCLQENDLVCGGKIVVLRIGKTEHRIISVQ
jgi:tyrosyl-tRNA synthetase